jgi:anti-sigma regulatory factor (Ser/Thr protein kinase)/ActR/RegA family two-component response regulator
MKARIGVETESILSHTLSTAAAPAQRKTVLLVHPDREVDHLLNQVVTEKGWDIQRAADNPTALLLAEANSFDLIITGEKTSGREDVDLLRKIRTVRPHVRMIILAADTTREDVIASLRFNAFSYFRPPFDRAMLADMVHRAVSEPCWDDGIEVISATPNWIRLMARCTVGTAERLVQFLRQADLPDAEKEDLAVAAHEMLMNAMEHGGKFDPNQYVEIDYLRTRRAVACRVKDPGQGFSFDELRHAAVGNSPEDILSHVAVREEQGLRPGGFGILLTRKLVDELIYDERGNDVILIKYLDQPAKPTP